MHSAPEPYAVGARNSAADAQDAGTTTKLTQVT